MGNKGSAPGLHGEAKLAAQKFDTEEIHVLRKTFEDLAERSNGKGIDKDTFLQYFPLSGLMGERLFAQFDKKNRGSIDFDEFLTGLAKVCRGTIDDKIRFIFDMYDVSKDGSVSKKDLEILLNQIPKAVLRAHFDIDGNGIVRNTSASNLPSSANSSEKGQEEVSEFSDEEHSPDKFEEVDSYTNHDIVERAFEECDLNHEGKLTYEEFKMWLMRNPALLEHVESILPYYGEKDRQPHHDKRESLPHMRRLSQMAQKGAHASDAAGDIFNHSTHSTSGRRASNASSRSFRGMESPAGLSPVIGGGTLTRAESGQFTMLQRDKRTHSFSGDSTIDDSEELARNFLIHAMEVTQKEELRKGINSLLELYCGGLVDVPLGGRKRVDSEVYHTVVRMEDFLWKKGKSFHMMSSRYFLLSGNCLYYYVHKSDIRPKGIVFITGSLVERIKDEDMALKGYFGFELLNQDLCTGEHKKHEKRVLYCKTEALRDKWVTALQHAAHVVPIEDEYVIGRELGRGRFSVVCECVHKETGLHYAVKKIDKKTIEKDEKELLRTEIAVLKLVNHPNIIRMVGLYESRQFIYIVMEMLKGGELFERIVGRPRFTELEAARLLRPLLEAVAYLHDLGIVHRDLKPENILCGEDLEDLKIADFGLSKMVMPKDRMDAACGTLSYVAPEVLTMQGYGKEADLWSVGVIMFLVLCGKLPFDGDDHNEIIRSTIQGDLKVNPAVWGKLSEEARSMLTSLLNKNPRDRITARDALKHPFLVQHNLHRRNTVHPLVTNSNAQSQNPSPTPSPSAAPAAAVNQALNAPTPPGTPHHMMPLGIAATEKGHAYDTDSLTVKTDDVGLDIETESNSGSLPKPFKPVSDPVH